MVKQQKTSKSVEVMETQVNIINSESSNWGYSRQAQSNSELQKARVVEVHVPLAQEKVLAPACRISTDIEDPQFNSW